MLTFRMLRIFNGLAMLFANFFEGKLFTVLDPYKSSNINFSRISKETNLYLVTDTIIEILLLKSL